MCSNIFVHRSIVLVKSRLPKLRQFPWVPTKPKSFRSRILTFTMKYATFKNKKGTNLSNWCCCFRCQTKVNNMQIVRHNELNGPARKSNPGVGLAHIQNKLCRAVEGGSMWGPGAKTGYRGVGYLQISQLCKTNILALIPSWYSYHSIAENISHPLCVRLVPLYSHWLSIFHCGAYPKAQMAPHPNTDRVAAPRGWTPSNYQGFQRSRCKNGNCQCSRS